jgi:DNA-binding Xre family transcriptional regulator
MLNPAEINPLALPSVALDDRRQLPVEPCIYFAIDGQGVVQYVGQSQNPRRRWQGHNQLKHLSKMTGVCVAYMPVRPSLLTGFEEILISKYRPALNCLDVRPLIKLGMDDYWEKLKNVIAPRGFSMQVIQTKKWGVSDLPYILASAQQASSKTVDQICQEAGISEITWRRLVAGASSTIQLSTLFRICDALGVSLSSLGIKPD